MWIEQTLSLKQKLEILSDAAKYDVACTSSGVERKAEKGTMGSASACGICHSFTADGRCVSLLKILMSNECVYDCAYCINRISNDTVRATFTPEEICTLTMEFYRRNYIEGLFLSSGIIKDPTYTMQKMWEAVYLLRHKYHFFGYIHVKTIPGADPAIIEELGYLADRMSVNLEFPTSKGLQMLAPSKTRKSILTPMKQIMAGIGLSSEGHVSNQMLAYTGKEIVDNPLERSLLKEVKDLPDISMQERAKVGYVVNGNKSKFAPAGQSTQMMIGATDETDYHIMSVSEALYKNFNLKRVFYSAFIRVNEDPKLPAVVGPPPLLREHRLYQADWLLRFYGFKVSELLHENHQNFDAYIDPKCDWALQHMDQFPVEVNRAPYEMLLRVPGIGVKSAKRIIAARRTTKLDFDSLKRIGVVLKRAHYFLLCNGRMMYPVSLNPDQIVSNLRSCEEQKNWQIAHAFSSARQMSLFDDFGISSIPSKEDAYATITGQF